MSLGGPLGRRLLLDLDAAQRHFGVDCHWIWIRLGVSRALSFTGFRSGSASLGRCMSLDLDAARRRLGVVCQWIQMRLGVAWAFSVTKFRRGSAPLG